MKAGITAEQVRRILLALAADEVRLAQDAPRPLSVAAIRDHAASHAFCRSIAREAANDTRIADAEHRVEAHLRRRR